MATYVTRYIYKDKLPDGSKIWTLTADTEKELHKMAELINAEKDKFSSESSVPFYIISHSKAKLARNNGALYDKQAEEVIDMIHRMLESKIPIKFN